MPVDGDVDEPRPNALSAKSSLRFDDELDAKCCHRSVATSRVTAIGQVRPTLTPGCCHGKRSVSNGQEEKMLQLAGIKGAVQSV